MTVAFSAALEVGVLNWVKGTDFGSAPSAVQFGLLTAAPGHDNTNLNELNGDGYNRQDVTFGSITTDNTARLSSMTNTGAVIFGPASADWDPATYGAFFNKDDGSLIAYGPLAANRTAPNGDTISFGVDSLQLRSR